MAQHEVESRVAKRQPCGVRLHECSQRAFDPQVLARKRELTARNVNARRTCTGAGESHQVESGAASDIEHVTVPPAVECNELRQISELRIPVSSHRCKVAG